MCPVPFTRPHVTYLPSDVHDQRSCGACTCAANATKCDNATLEGYDNSACNSSHHVTEKADGGCNSGGSVFTSIAYIKYSATPDVDGCGVQGSGPPVNNPIQYDNPITICCLP